MIWPTMHAAIMISQSARASLLSALMYYSDTSSSSREQNSGADLTKDETAYLSVAASAIFSANCPRITKTQSTNQRERKCG